MMIFPQFAAIRRNSPQNATIRPKTLQNAKKNPQIDAIHRKLTQFAAICHNSP